MHDGGLRAANARDGVNISGGMGSAFDSKDPAMLESSESTGVNGSEGT